ncbi:MAG: hypothetical protein JNK82_28855 [Myxococcaceae bacterium]|nr:hypothetical protein [Myxococcaceae bacterium]
MPTKVTSANIADLLASSARYIEGQVKKANTNGNTVITKTEAKKLAADLQDNFAASLFKTSTGSVSTKDLQKEFLVMMAAWSNAADKNKDGRITATEANAMPKVLRDNVINYIESLNRDVQSVGEYTTRNTTPPSRVQEHLAAFGKTKITYEKAFEIGLKAVATEESGIRGFVEQFGGPDGDPLTNPAAIKAEVKRLLKEGSMELIPKDEEIPNGSSNADNWIFSVSTDGQGDHGVWAIVDRKTGDVFVDNFN